MNRKFLGLMATAFAFCSTASCSDKSASDITGVTLNDSTAGAALTPGPSGVADLQASATGSASVTLSFTQVNDGTGQPAKYDVRFAAAPISWSSAPSVTGGTCSTPVGGTATGTQLTCTVLGLTASTSYNFQLVSFRGTMNMNAVYGPLSNIASATTTSSTPAPPPPPVPVASVTVTPASATLAIGATVQLQVSAFDASNNPLTGRVVTSSSADSAIASVNSAGLVTAVSAGTTQITCTSEGKSAVATIIVAAPPAPPPPAPPPAGSPGTVNDLQASVTGSTSVTLSFTQVNDGTGQPAKYNVRYAVAPIEWGAATSTTSGTCSTPVAGTATGAQLSCTVLGLTPATNYNFQLAAFRGTMNQNAVYGGLSNIATAATTSSTPPPPAPVATVTVSPASLSVQPGATAQFSAVTRDAGNNILTGRSIVWSSSNTSAATISASGLITALAAGTTTITASSEGKTGTANLTVTAVPVASVTVTPSSASILIGATVQLLVTARDANNNVLTGRVVTSSSASSGVATVTSLGVVRGVSVGTTQITVTVEGKTATSAITVTAPPPAAVATVTVTPAAASLQVGATAQLAASMRDVNNNVLTGRVVTWSSANTAIATVNSSGVVSAVSTGGPVQITATSETKTGTSAITVTAAPPPPPPGGWRAHEPAGMTTLTDQGFTSLPSNGWTGWFNYDIASDATGPRSPGGAFENIYPAGMSGGINPGLAEYQFSPRKTLYVSMYVKHSANFQGHASSVNKIIHIWIGGLNHLFLNAAGTGSGALRGQVRLQGIAGGGNFDGGTAGIYDNGVNMTRNQWHLLEVIAVANTGSNKDGSVSLYVDGVLAATCSGIEFEGNAPSWNLVKIDPTWGGTGDRVTSAMSIRVDQIYMSGK